MSGKKILFIVLGVAALLAIVAGTVIHSHSDVLPVTTSRSVKQDLDADVSGVRPDYSPVREGRRPREGRGYPGKGGERAA
jgi:hypothetical protein